MTKKKSTWPFHITYGAIIAIPWGFFHDFGFWQYAFSLITCPLGSRAAVYLIQRQYFPNSKQ